MHAIIIILVGLLLVSELSTKSVYGSFISNKEVSEYVNGYDYFELNPYSKTLISGMNENETREDLLNRLVDRTYISTTPLSIFSKYYINGKGRVFIFSKGSKQIDNLYKNLK